MAARDARAAAGQAAHNRVSWRENGRVGEPTGCRFQGAAASTRLDRGPHHRDRVALGGGTQRSRQRDRGGAHAAQGRYHRHHRNSASHRPEAGHVDHPDRFPDDGRSGRRWPDRVTGKAGRQRHGAIALAAGPWRQAIGGPARGSSRLTPACDFGQFQQSPNAQELREVQAAADRLGVEVATIEIRRVEDIRPAFDALKGVDALYLANDQLILSNRTRINIMALVARLPTIYNSREYVEEGGLVSYGPNFVDLFRRAADFVDKILRGAKPGNIPVEQPTKFDLVINLTTAKAIGLTIPPTLLSRADEVIE